MFCADDMYSIEQLRRTTRGNCGPRRLALCAVNTGFAHFIFLFEDDGVVSASASNSKEGTASKLSPLEMSPFKRRRSTVAVRLDTCRRRA
jgi:hypothetical protein